MPASEPRAAPRRISRLFVALPLSRDLLFRANNLSIAAKTAQVKKVTRIHALWPNPVILLRVTPLRRTRHDPIFSTAPTYCARGPRSQRFSYALCRSHVGQCGPWAALAGGPREARQQDLA